MELISYYNHAKDTKDTDVLLLDFLRGIKDGKWQDEVLKIRTIPDKKLRTLEKQKVPLVTISGSFRGRSDNEIRKHSGFIAIDIDDLNVNTTKAILEKDQYVYSAFTSISGNGLCVLFKIDGSRHLDAFNGIGKYLYDEYQIIIDQSCKNVSRARFVSFDPYLFLNETALIFKKYLQKEKPRKITRVVFVKSDFDAIIKQLYDRSINLCENYSEWVSIAYSLISEFGESGVQYYHTLSSLSDKYNKDDTERQYNSCFKNAGSKSKVSTIGSIYWYAKQNGIDIYSAQTKEIIRNASSQRRSGIQVDDIKKNLQELSGIDPKVSDPIVNQIIGNNIEHKSENIAEDLIMFIRPYLLKKNLITRNVERKGKPIDDSDINSIFLDAKTVYKEANKDLICSILFSNRILQYNPIHDFFNSCEIVDKYPNLNLLLQSIITDTVNYDKWVTKWLVSMIASAYGNHSPLMLVFAGELQGTGKTHWFRYLLPQKLQPLFAESKMDAGKDDEILMTKKWIILDDEFGGKSKREEKRLKEITSKAWINVREPYGRVSVDLRRLAIFCGTSNDTQILNDPTGNRRILPIHINSIDHDNYNKCNKEQLLIELYSLYKEGFNYTILKQDIEELNTNTDEFKQSGVEEELLFDKIMQGSQQYGEWMNITAIIQYLIAETKYSTLSNKRIGQLLTNHKYEKKRMKLNGAVVTAFFINRKSGNNDLF